MHSITDELVKYHQTELLDEARRLHGFRVPTLVPFVSFVTATIERTRARVAGGTPSHAPVVCAAC